MFFFFFSRVVFLIEDIFRRHDCPNHFHTLCASGPYGVGTGYGVGAGTGAAGLPGAKPLKTPGVRHFKLVSHLLDNIRCVKLKRLVISA